MEQLGLEGSIQIMENVTEILKFKLKNKLDVFTVFPNDRKRQIRKR